MTPEETMALEVLNAICSDLADDDLTGAQQIAWHAGREAISALTAKQAAQGETPPADLVKAARDALEVLASATSFHSRKARDRCPDVVSALRAALPPDPPSPPLNPMCAWPLEPKA